MLKSNIFGEKMKKFTKILICLLICVFCFGLTACGGSKDLFTMPSGEVTGNGGLVVQKGEYLYFVNGYKTADSTTSANGNMVGALMVAKLDGNGNVVRNEDDLLNDAYYWTMSNKLCGFQATGLYIFGEYLYFTCQCEAQDSKLTWASDRVEFYRVKLNNSGSVEKVYTTEVNNQNTVYNFFETESGLYLLVYEKGTNLDHGEISNRLVRVNLNGKVSSVEVGRDVSSAVIKSESQEKPEENIFYVTNTKKANNSGSEYQIWKYNINNNTKTSFSEKQDEEMTLKFVGSNFVYFEMADELDSSMKDLYRSSVTSSSTRLFCSNIGNYDSVYFLNDTRIIGIDGNAIEFCDYEQTDNPTPQTLFEDEDATAINVIGFINHKSLVYYDNNNNIKILDDVSKFAEKPIMTTIAKIDNWDSSAYSTTNGEVKFDLDNNFVYFYEKVGANYYLHRLSLNNITENEKEEMIGVYLTADAPKEDEE